MGYVCPVKTDRALVGGNQAGDHVEHRCFAGAIGSEKTYGFTTPYSECHSAHDGTALVALGEQTGDNPFARRLAMELRVPTGLLAHGARILCPVWRIYRHTRTPNTSNFTVLRHLITAYLC
jgi:hypothetical protein